MSVPPKSFSYHWRGYLALMSQFRNAPSLMWAHRYRRSLDRAVLWNGRTIENVQHRGGFVDTVVEIWGRQEYSHGDFYRPSDSDVVLDVGANIGLFSLWIARHAPHARVYAFEPEAENFATLQANIAGCEAVRAQQCAIGATAGLGHMNGAHTRSLDYRLVMDDTPHAAAVPVVTLENAVALTGAPAIDLLKMDIEGAEADALAAAPRDTLQRIKRIALEYHDHLRPGGCALIQSVLAPTHTILDITDGPDYGMLFAVAR